MSASGQLKEISIRNQVLLEMLKEGAHRDFLPFLNSMERATRRAIYEFGDIGTKQRLNEIVRDIAAIQIDIMAEWREDFTGTFEELATQQASIEAEAYNSIVKDYDAPIPAPNKIVAAYKVNPMTVQDYSGNQLLEPFLKDFSNQAIQRIRNEVTAGYYRGATIQEIVDAIGGATDKIRRQNKTIIRTAYQHVAQSARQEVQLANRDIASKYEWVSTLDSKTSPQCRGLDGQRFDIGDGPKPPIHPNCRSTTVAVLDIDDGQVFEDELGVRATETGQVSESTSYYGWLKRQPASFQDKVIGPKRGKILRNGGINAEEFAKLSLDKNFKPISLEDMKKARPDIFEKANVNL